MDHFKRGITFLQQIWRMAREDPDLLKPSLYALAAGLALSLICLIPIALSLVVPGEQPARAAPGGLFWGSAGVRPAPVRLPLLGDDDLPAVRRG